MISFQFANNLQPSDNILPHNHCESESFESVRLRDKSVLHLENNNQDNYPTYYPAPLLLSPPSSAFRWSEQLTQHAAVAKLRTAISCNSQDLREMEFLLPRQAHGSTHTMSMSGGSGQPQLCISRHSQPKNAKLRDDHEDQSPELESLEQSLASNAAGDENASSNHQHQLTVHRQSVVQLRSKIATGNTPHPRVSKMTKKQLKLAQAQLDKLTQSNLHLHGRHTSSRCSHCSTFQLEA